VAGEAIAARPRSMSRLVAATTASGWVSGLERRASETELTTQIQSKSNRPATKHFGHTFAAAKHGNAEPKQPEGSGN